MTVVGIVLAAGRGARMGRPKQLLPLDGRPMLQHVLDAAAAAPLDDLVLVLGHAAGEVRAALRPPPGTRVVVNAAHAEGQSTSLRAGLAAAPEGALAAVVLLGDQPEVRAEAVAALVAAHARSVAPVLRAAYGGRAAHPVLLGRAIWPAAMALRGDAGARALISREAVELVEVGGAPPEDVDTPADHAALVARSAARHSGS